MDVLLSCKHIGIALLGQEEMTRLSQYIQRSPRGFWEAYKQGMKAEVLAQRFSNLDLQMFRTTIPMCPSQQGHWLVGFPEASLILMAKNKHTDCFVGSD